MIFDKCPDCGETAIVECTNCLNQSYCPSCGSCAMDCNPERKNRNTKHITLRVNQSLHNELDAILKRELKSNPFRTKSDVIRDLIRTGIEHY